MPSPFETAIGKLSALIGDDQAQAPQQPSNAMAIGYRASMLPIGNYEDGSVAFPVWPQGALDLADSWRQFTNAAEAARGIPHTAEESFPREKDSILPGSVMFGGGFGGLGSRAAGSSAARFAANPKEAAPTGMLAAANAGERQGIRAYHGSPHDFDRFDAARMGSGEGNNAYGQGLYFAESEDVARSYRDALAGQGNAPNGRMYEVNINADPAAFLDWDKPLSQQPEVVRRALEPLARSEAEREIKQLEAMMRTADIRSKQMGVEPKPRPPMPSVDEYAAGMYGNQFVGQENALREAGIPGMRYLDGYSRDTGQGTTNYVVFPGNENLIDIMRKYANPKEGAPVGLLAASNLERMRAEDAVKPRPFPDAPQTMPELETYLQKNVDGNSRTRADEAWAADPTRYNAYSHGMADLLNPESQWWKGDPTLQSGGSMAPAAATGSIEHHSRSQPRGAGGRFVGRESFDGRLAALDKMMVDLDGDGVPDVAVSGPQSARMNPEIWPSDVHFQKTIDEINSDTPLPPAWDERPSPMPFPWRG